MVPIWISVGIDVRCKSIAICLKYRLRMLSSRRLPITHGTETDQLINKCYEAYKNARMGIITHTLSSGIGGDRESIQKRQLRSSTQKILFGFVILS